MSAERHRRVKELFLATCDLGAEERHVLLARECGADSDLRRAVEEMLAVDADVVPVLDKPALAPEGSPTAAPSRASGNAG